MPTRAIVLIDHGSKNAEVEEYMRNLIATLQLKWTDTKIYHAHMEVNSPFLDEVLDTLVRTGIVHVLIYPFFLIPGRHLQKDMPALVAAMQQKYPALCITLGKSLGQCEHLSEWVASHLKGQF